MKAIWKTAMNRSIIETEIISSTNKAKEKGKNIKVFYCSKIKPFFGVTSTSRSQNNASCYKSRQYAIRFSNLLVYNVYSARRISSWDWSRDKMKLNGNGFAFGSFEWKTEKKREPFLVRLCHVSPLKIQLLNSCTSLIVSTTNTSG